VAPADLLNEADGTGDRGGRVVGQAERQGEEEQGLGVGGSFDVG
jgi:hypothetical protein